MRIIALEEHYWTREIAGALAAVKGVDHDDSLDFFNTAEVFARLEDLGEARLSAMDMAGVDAALLSVTSPATQTLSPDLAVTLARQANDRLAAATAIAPERMFGFATLPTSSPAIACDELKRCVEELNFRGAMIHGRTETRYLDHPNFRPILSTAAALGVPIYIHPQIAPRAVRALHYDGFGHDLSIGLATGGWGWHQETAINALRLIIAGVFDELPSLQIILGHWGEMLPFYIERANEMNRVSKLSKPIKDYLRSNVFVTPSGMLSDVYLRFALEVMGADRIMVATDYPFQFRNDHAIRTFIENAPIAEYDRHRIAHGNAERLLGI